MVRHRSVSLVNRIAELVIVLHRLDLCVSKVWRWQNLRLRLLDRNDWLLLLVGVLLKRHKLTCRLIDPADRLCHVSGRRMNWRSSSAPSHDDWGLASTATSGRLIVGWWCITSGLLVDCICGHCVLGGSCGRLLLLGLLLWGVLG